MRIGIIIICFLPSAAYGGPATVAAQQAKELSRRGHEVTVLTTNILDPRGNIRSEVRTEVLDGYKVIRFPGIVITNSFASIYSLQFQKWLKRNAKGFDIFHIHYARGIIPWMQTGLLLRSQAHIVLQPHGMLDKQTGLRKLLDIFITERHLRKSNQVLALQEKEFSVLKKLNSDSKVIIIPNGISISSSFPRWDDNNDSPTILFLSRLHPRKRVLLVIRAAYQLLKNYPNLQIRIVGPDGGDEKAARVYVDENGNTENFHFLGSMEHQDALDELADATVFVLPSYDEPFSYVVLEAMVIGTPTIVTDSFQNLNVLTEFNAVEVSQGTVDALAESIDKLLSNSELRFLLSEKGKKTVRERLSIEKVVDLLEEAYLA